MKCPGPWQDVQTDKFQPWIDQNQLSNLNSVVSRSHTVTTSVTGGQHVDNVPEPPHPPHTPHLPRSCSAADCQPERNGSAAQTVIQFPVSESVSQIRVIRIRDASTHRTVVHGTLTKLVSAVEKIPEWHAINTVTHCDSATDNLILRLSFDHLQLHNSLNPTFLL
jgi:hypothetical protein